ncbi:pyruvate, water dikinase [Actinopolymorpha cephalotaxi]|uniref:Pyruvate, water dikinase n=1 Tax=Actinopolymorpha cephalotaxi TaxID=504797 RepID=A0A1I2NEW3_9ACTN|nr:PEP/pyruvate-binding domain-containing protein [Actinopolymorpha cephalotaxi]NYH85634.1 pyruvate,water dikinase [Actinopolymorpha cephalotaxi]SFG00056.1 pyruvate, water dikinase [Actinopolymorpha cephalotaxi]
MRVITSLAAATPDTCGAKAATLATLLRHGFPVPDGFVVTFDAYRAARAAAPEQARPDGRGGGGGEWTMPDLLAEHVSRKLTELGDPPVAVRSSAANEDGRAASAAGQYETVLAVRGTRAVLDAVATCWRSAGSDRVAGYRGRFHPSYEPDEPGGVPMAVLVQRLVEAEMSGVMFTPDRTRTSTRIEAAWGLGPSVADGTLTPDSYEVGATWRITRLTPDKPTRLDRDGAGVARRPVPESQRGRGVLDDPTVAELAAVGHRIADVLGVPQDVEWAIAAGRVWIVQARPITAPLPGLPGGTPTTSTLAGIPGSLGTATGPARILRGPSDFSRTQPGDVVVCRYTDPAWTPLFRIAAAVVTETGGALSHAAIVAREYAIPAVLGVPDATTRILDGELLTVDGTAGVVTPVRH